MQIVAIGSIASVSAVAAVAVANPEQNCEKAWMREIEWIADHCEKK